MLLTELSGATNEAKMDVGGGIREMTEIEGPALGSFGVRRVFR